MISFHEPDPDMPVLAPIVNSAGGDILRFLLAEDKQPSLNSESVVMRESRIADCRVAGSLTRDCLTSSTKNSSVHYFCNRELLLQDVGSSNLFVIMAHNTMNIYEVMM